jgi:Asp-tRNA(Asn)/Glu-tRNA(Gln) amidotransferase A subunit family amidase
MRSAQHDDRIQHKTRALGVLLALSALAAGCTDDDDPVVSCDASEPVTVEDAAVSDAAEPEPERPPFKLIEATIDDIQYAIKKGELTCKQLVQLYIDRIAAYNGPCTQLVTADGAPIAPALGYVRAGTRIAYPTETFAAAGMLPDLSQYAGPPLDFGHMESSISEPTAQQQIGLITGIPDAGQVNALETVNLRGERSLVCKGEYDKHPDEGPLPADAPPACEAFRQFPDALERAAELDAEYGSDPDLEQLPMYCVTFSVKNWYDAKDMHSTGGNDVAFAMDAPPSDSTMVAELRDKGAIILAKSIASQVGNTSSGPVVANNFFPPSTDNARATWGGTVCTPYDTARSPGFSSGGAGASVATNMVTCGICETTGGSCRIPASPNNVASLVTTKGIISSDDGWTAQFVNHRPGVLCRTLGDAARVLDAMKDPETGYFDSNDFFTALPKPLIPDKPYASFTYHDADLDETPKLLAGMRIGVVREFMISPNLNNRAINAEIDMEIKSVLRDVLGAEIVESVDPLYPDDPDVENMSFTFSTAFAQVLPVSVPEYFFQMANGALEFAVPGFDVRTKDYLLKLAAGKAPLSDNINLRRVTGGLDNTLRTPFIMDQYLLKRADTKVSDWPSFVANARWFTDSLRAGSENTANQNTQDIRATSGIDRLKMVSVARLVVSKVMYENGLDVLVTTNIPAPVERNEFARDPTLKEVRPNGPSITDLLGVPEISVPAGYNQVVYEVKYALNAAKTSYVATAGTVETLMQNPMPTSMMFFAGPGEEPAVLMAASAYEAATHHRKPPADFGPLPSEP